MSDSRARKLVRTFTATPQDLQMLEALARYHGFSKSAMITSLLKKEFWRVFPKGTGDVRPEPGARIRGETEAPQETQAIVAPREGGTP
ncbi:MAG: hypothetical protein HY721_24425 [Planctomycetes bacterium]|nr:hypothetical protein [Planctomycetota bacterium]